MNVMIAPTSSDFGWPLRIPGIAITTAAASATSDPIFSVACAASTVKMIHGISAIKIPLPPALGSALSLLVEDMKFSFRLT